METRRPPVRREQKKRCRTGKEKKKGNRTLVHVCRGNYTQFNLHEKHSFMGNAKSIKHAEQSHEKKKETAQSIRRHRCPFESACMHTHTHIHRDEHKYTRMHKCCRMHACRSLRVGVEGSAAAVAGGLFLAISGTLFARSCFCGLCLLRSQLQLYCTRHRDGAGVVLGSAKRGGDQVSETR